MHLFLASGGKREQESAMEKQTTADFIRLCKLESKCFVGIL